MSPCEILYRDDRVLVLDKPSGVAVHRGWETQGPFAVDLARERAGRPVFPVHRLDRGTSGALAFALDPESARALHEAFEQGRVRKRYLALVRGVAPAHAVVDHPIPRREGGPRVPAVTELSRLAVSPDGTLSLVEAVPRTGRLHQVRRHLKHLHHPIIGDANYGKGAQNRELRARVGLSRLALHALELTIEPSVFPGAAELRVRAPLPADLVEPIVRLGILIDSAHPALAVDARPTANIIE